MYAIFRGLLGILPGISKFLLIYSTIFRGNAQFSAEAWLKSSRLDYQSFDKLDS